jgi:hypothetical protein
MTTPLEKAQAAMRAKREAGEQIVRLSPREKAERNPKSLRFAANAKCFDCVGGDNADGGFRRCIRECPSVMCPLHNLRPYQRNESDDDDGPEAA